MRTSIPMVLLVLLSLCSLAAEPTTDWKASREKADVGAAENVFDAPGSGCLGKGSLRSGVLSASAKETRTADEHRGGAMSSGIRGKVLLDGTVVAGVRVHAYADAIGNFAGEGLACSEPTGADGVFLLPLRPGRYFLVGKGVEASPAAKNSGPKGLFGYYGGNPVTVWDGAPFEANVHVVRSMLASIETWEGKNGVVEGVVLGGQGPEQGASIYLYPNASGDFRGPDLSGPQGSFPKGTGPDGRFFVEVPPGTYYLVGLRREGGALAGPLRAGDRYGYFAGNPVAVRANQRIRVTLPLVEKMRESGAGSSGSSRVTGIRGVVRDPQGRAVSGVFAFASTDPNLIGRMPPFRSQPVGADGAYAIDLPAGGVFYVGARSGYGGPPLPGQWQGIYGDPERKAVTVETGQFIEGIDVTVSLVK